MLSLMEDEYCDYKRSTWEITKKKIKPYQIQTNNHKVSKQTKQAYKKRNTKEAYIIKDQ